MYIVVRFIDSFIDEVQFIDWLIEFGWIYWFINKIFIHSFTKQLINIFFINLLLKFNSFINLLYLVEVIYLFINNFDLFVHI